MKVWEKIAASSDDTDGWDKKRIADEAYMLKYPPCEMEDKHCFVGEGRRREFCNGDCGRECLDKYLEMEVQP